MDRQKWSQLVADSLNPANQVLSFSGVNFSGDIFIIAEEEAKQIMDAAESSDCGKKK